MCKAQYRYHSESQMHEGRKYTENNNMDKQMDKQ